MNSTHVSVGIGTTTTTALLTTLLTGWHGIDADHATAFAGIVTLMGAAVLAVAGRVVTHFWPWLCGPAPAAIARPAA